MFCDYSGSEPSLLLSDYLYGSYVQDHRQHDSARMTDEADSSVFLTEM